MSQGLRRFPWAVPLAICLLLTLAGCGGSPEMPGDRKLVVIGFDAADLAEIDSLVTAGRMPATAGFLEQGVAGTNMSFVPLQKSPLIWASMATGLMPEQHGIGGFLRNSGRLNTARDWKAPAYWHIIGETGRTACVIGWWVTYPASSIEGVLVSDAYTYTDSGLRDPRGLVRPDSLQTALLDLVVDYRDISLEDLGRYVDLVALSGHEDALATSLDDLRVILAGDLTYMNFARYLAQRGDYDVFSVYFRGLDLVCHKFWHFHHPESVHRRIVDPALSAFRNVVPAYYEFCDEMLAELLTLFPSDRSVVILSDHGFRREALPRGRHTGGVNAHRAEGVIAMRSPLHVPGTRFDQTDVINVGPTLLALLGLPPSEEMPGRIVTEGLTDSGRRYVERLEGERVPGYGGFAPGGGDSLGGDAEMDEATKRQLRSLGYIN